MEPAIFLDKDGTLIQDVAYNVEPSKIAFYPDIFAPLQELAASGYALILISNQSGIAKGLFKEQGLRIAFDYIVDQLSKKEIPIRGYYYCPHDIDRACSCRKPKPGLIKQAAAVHSIDVSRSWMIGDILSDVGAGLAAGCKTILIDRDGTQRKLVGAHADSFRPDYIHDDFRAVLQSISPQKTKPSALRLGPQPAQNL